MTSTESPKSILKIIQYRCALASATVPLVLLWGGGFDFYYQWRSLCVTAIRVHAVLAHGTISVLRLRFYREGTKRITCLSAESWARAEAMDASLCGFGKCRT